MGNGYSSRERRRFFHGHHMFYSSSMRLPAAVLALLLCTSAVAEDAPAYLVAGYKALFTCSGTFLAGRTQEQIERTLLTGIYREYEPVMSALPAAFIDRQRKLVRVDWSDVLPPRIARFNPPLGCVLLPPGAGPDMPLPSATLEGHRIPAATLDWPAGDRVAEAPLGPDALGRPLSRALARAFDGRTYGPGSRTSAVVIVKGGKLVAEGYSADSGIHVPQRTWSVAKTIMAALIGIAVDDGLLRPDEAAGIPQWSQPGDPRRAIRVDHLLHMASGRDAGLLGSRTDEVYFGGALVQDQALTATLVAPSGRRWFYANNDTLALSWILRQRIGDDRRYLAFPHDRLFRPLGMRHTTAETDWGGTFILSSQVWTTARDLARFGLLLLNDGVWLNQRILPAGWVKYMTTPAPAQPPASEGIGYGAQVWLYGPKNGLPEGTFSAIGNRGQYVMVIPSADVVIVRRGFDPVHGRFQMDRFAAEVLEALETRSP